MRRVILWAVGGLVVIATLSAGFWLTLPTLDIPDDPDEVILFSLDGKRTRPRDPAEPPPDSAEVMHNYPVLGRVEITDPGKRREVVAAVQSAVRWGILTEQAKCFWPRHVLRMAKGGSWVDVVICFQCHNYQVHRAGSPNTGFLPISKSAEPLFSQILTDAGAAIAAPE